MTVRFGSKGDINQWILDVRSPPGERTSAARKPCPLSANKKLMRRSIGPLFNHLVGNQQEFAAYCQS